MNMIRILQFVTITFDDNHKVDVRTWRKAFVAILKKCNEDPIMHQRLLELRGNVYGRQRLILGDSPNGMDIPLEIDDGIFVEGKYDAETMMHVLTKLIFHPIGFDYSGIQITIRDPQHFGEAVMSEDQRTDEPSHTMEMQM